MMAAEKRVAVVNGGAGGIGQAVVLRLARAGFFPAILDHDEAAGRAALARLEAGGASSQFLALDLTRKAEVRDAFDTVLSEHGRVDALVNLAGGTLHRHPVQEFPLTEWQQVI